MNIEVLRIDGCPNWVEAGKLLREALDATGLDDTEVNCRLLATVEDAARVPFAGSPTIVLDGGDRCLVASGRRLSMLPTKGRAMQASDIQVALSLVDLSVTDLMRKETPP